MIDQVMTVLGPVDAATLGPTLPHEHLLVDLTCYCHRPSEPDAIRAFEEPVQMHNLWRMRRDAHGSLDNCLLTDVDVAVEEAMDFRRLGGRTIVDATNADIGRDPAALQEISRRTGLNVVMGCGHYRSLAHPASLAGETADEIAERLIRETVEGVGPAAVRPGIIGEIGTGDPIDPEELKVLRAVARVQRETGLAISVHVEPSGRRGHEVLDILESEGVAPDRVVLAHSDAVLGHIDLSFDEAVEHHRSLARRGCWVEYDLCGCEGYYVTPSVSWMPSDRERVKALAILIADGFGAQLLLSQDLGHKHFLKRWGGWGYGHVMGAFSEQMKRVGISADAITRILVENPRAMLVGRGIQAAG